MVIAAVCAWHLRRRGADVLLFGRSLRVALAVVLGATILTSVTGHFQAELLVDQQPMKMAAAEALFETRDHAPLSLFATGDWTPNPGRTNVDVQAGGVLSLLATGSTAGTVRGINDLERSYRARYGPGEYAPVVAVTYWSFRAMIGAGTALILLCVLALWRLRGARLVQRRRLLWLLLPAVALPFVANSAGWIFTEMGRQPWIVQGLLKTSDAVSPTVNATSVWLSMIGFTALYGGLAVIGLRLFARTVRKGPEPELESDTEGDDSPAPGPAPEHVLVY
jgi:cytochrome d ubiquinol oxidase subunit I